MCVAVPIEVVELKTVEGFEDRPLIAIVNASGIKKEVRLDIVDRIPKVGDFVIVHAGFAIHSLEKKEALRNLDLLHQLEF